MRPWTTDDEINLNLIDRTLRGIDDRGRAEKLSGTEGRPLEAEIGRVMLQQDSGRQAGRIDRMVGVGADFHEELLADVEEDGTDFSVRDIRAGRVRIPNAEEAGTQVHG
jgi:hypothetical protein